MIDLKDILPVLAQFGFEDATKIEKFGNGHINQTYIVSSPSQSAILQQINQQVFPQPFAVTSNVSLICDYLSKIQASKSFPMQSMKSLLTQSGHAHFEFKGEVWRVLSYVPDCYSPDKIDCATQAFDTAFAFATFAHALSGFNVASLQTVIPRFHDLGFRYEQLTQAINANSARRLIQAKQELDFALVNKWMVAEAKNAEQNCPIRVTHNDTKINNLLFGNKTHKPVAVVDLDTCMPGYVMHDFGDMVRTCCATLAEDDANTDKMQIKTEIFKALAEGYLAAWGDGLTAVEIQSLWLGAKMMPLMIGIRFLTDFINGDVYFATKYPEHNLHRAQNQFALYRAIIAKEAELKQYFSICEAEPA